MSDDYIKLGGYHDGYAKVRFSSGKYGFVHMYGELLPGKYVEVEPFKNGVAFVKLDSGRWIAINTKGDYVRSDYTYSDFLREKERDNNRLKLKRIIDDSIDDMNSYIDRMSDYLDEIKSKHKR